MRSVANGKVLRDLTLGESVEDLGPDTSAGWRKIKVQDISGVAFNKYLRTPLHSNIEALLRAALDEWLFFGKGTSNEKSEMHYKRVGEMWNALGEQYDGRSKYSDGKDVPWSAAFISWVVRNAGTPYANFKFSSSHSVFVNNAIKAQVTGRRDKPFWGYPITEAKVELGDIVQRNRGDGAYSFSYAENHSQYESHSDIVVEVTSSVARVLGGNVSDSVTLQGSKQEYELDERGHIKPNQNVIAILKNRTGLRVEN